MFNKVREKFRRRCRKRLREALVSAVEDTSEAYLVEKV
jgi:hypothetical protein